jgi:hypothetical protein
MRRAFLVAAFLLAGAVPSLGGIRAPSCVALVAFSLGSRSDPVEIAFGKPAAAMTVDDFDQAIDIVATCIDEVESREPDIPGLTQRERKRPQLVALTQFAEDLRLYRSQRRESERRAAQRVQGQSDE